MKKSKPEKLVFHNLFIKHKSGYTGICLELNVASEGDTLEEAKKNVKEAVTLYLESVYQHGDEQESIPRPAPVEYWLKYFSLQERELRSALNSEIKRLSAMYEKELEEQGALKEVVESMLDFREAVA